jgi:hypothetical protein
MKATYPENEGWTRRAILAGAGGWLIGIAAGCHAAESADSSGAEQRTTGPTPRPDSQPPVPADALTPEMFGAKGDGVTNDSAAFAALSEAVNRRGGGTIALRRTTYIVGTQRRDMRQGAGYAFAPSPLLSFVGLRGPLAILGNGATMRCAPGLRYGTFSAATGERTSHVPPYFNQAERATPYEYMIYAENCAGPVTISDLELDGNTPKLAFGGAYGDTGIQIAGTGIFLRNNRGDELLRNIYSHHHPQDGVMIDGIDDPALARGRVRRAENVRCEYNCRQGCSLTGGRGWSFLRCTFSHTGKWGHPSNPGAGFDIEAEGGKTIRDIRFEDCTFSDNWGCGLVADSGDSEGATFLRCRFIGTSNWSIWPFKPNFRFQGCTIVGSAVHCFGDPDPRRATQFHDCLFTDDPKLSPNGKVYREDRPDGPLADLGEARNVLFNRCRLFAVGGAVLPWSTGAIYQDCVMKQGMKSLGYPRGEYRGRTTLNGRVDLYNTRFGGSLILNGQPYPPR